MYLKSVNAAHGSQWRNSPRRVASSRTEIVSTRSAAQEAFHALGCVDFIVSTPAMVAEPVASEAGPLLR